MSDNEGIRGQRLKSVPMTMLRVNNASRRTHEIDDSPER